MDNSLSRVSRGNISTTSLSNGVSPNGSQVKIKMCAFSRSLKEHPKLHVSDLEREREIREEREAKRLRNHPVCKSIKRQINNSRIRMDRLSRMLEQRLQKIEQKARALLPEKDGRYLPNFAYSFHGSCSETSRPRRNRHLAEALRHRPRKFKHDTTARTPFPEPRRARIRIRPKKRRCDRIGLPRFFTCRSPLTSPFRRLITRRLDKIRQC